MNEALSLRGITKRYGDTAILSVHELRLRSGEVVHLSGRNGAGKTTLLKIIAGLERPQHAAVWLDGYQGPWTRMARSLRRHVVYLHQRPFMFDASVADNLSYGLRAGGAPRSAIRTRVRQALAKVELNGMAQRNARTLSGGEQQRLALARAWVLNPRVLLLDEPTANMDVEFREQTWELLGSMLNRELSMVITHHERNGPGIAQCRKLRLEDGQLHEDSAAEATDNVILWPSETASRREAQS